MKVNVGGVDRIVRIVAGLALIAWALFGGGPLWAWIGVPVLLIGVFSFCFLSSIEGIIHTEVLKLYPDAELPRFHIEHHDAKRLSMRYESMRHFEDLAEGLITACVLHFGECIRVSRETVGSGDSRQERFILIRQ